MLSALADGELGAQAAMPELQHEDLHAHWNAYQTIGDVLRAPQAAVAVLAYGAEPAFLQRLSQRLLHEKIEKTGVPTAIAVVARPDTAAANDTNFRWKMALGLASFGAAVVVAWTVVGLPALKSEPQIAHGRAGTGTELVVASPLGLMVRDARLEELLSAHKQLGGTSLQAPSGFLRNAGFEPTPGSQR